MLWCAYPDGLAALSDSGGGGDDALEGRQNENEEKAAFQAHSVIGRLRLCKSPSPPLSSLLCSTSYKPVFSASFARVFRLGLIAGGD